jgi:hypothetical protein
MKYLRVNAAGRFYLVYLENIIKNSPANSSLNKAMS